MKSVSRFAMAFAITSLSLTAASGVSAAEEKPKKEKKGKEKPAEGFKANPSKEFSAVYNPVAGAYTKSKDAATAAASWAAIKAAIKTEDDRYVAGAFAVQIGRETKNDAMRVEGIDLVLASTATPANERMAYTFTKGAIAYDSKDWPAAETWLIKAHELGYKASSLPGGIEGLIAVALENQKKYPQALDWYQKAIDGSKAPGAAALQPRFYSDAANVSLKTKDYALIHKWMQVLVRNRNVPDFWRDALLQADYYAQLDSQETLDLMRLMRASGAMTQGQNYSAYVTDAMIALYPAEMQKVLQEGFDSKTITEQNLTFRDLSNQVKEKLASDPFSLAQLDKDIAGAKTGADSAYAGDLALSVGEYERAKTAYAAALAKGGLVGPKDGKDFSERSLYRLAVAKAMSGDVAGAKADFAKLQKPGLRVLADYWVIRLDLQAAAPAPAPAG